MVRKCFARDLKITSFNRHPHATLVYFLMYPNRESSWSRDLERLPCGFSVIAHYTLRLSREYSIRGAQTPASYTFYDYRVITRNLNIEISVTKSTILPVVWVRNLVPHSSHKGRLEVSEDTRYSLDNRLDFPSIPVSRLALRPSSLLSSVYLGHRCLTLTTHPVQCQGQD